MGVCYNPQGIGDVLCVMTHASTPDQDIAVEKKDNIVRIYDSKQKITLGWNFFNIQEILPELTGSGPILLTQAQYHTLQNIVSDHHMSEDFVYDIQPKIISGRVITCEPHPDSDHLSVTQVQVSTKEHPLLQIVCGASNVRAGLVTVVATEGALMPNGMMIWPGKLRGVVSEGMLCSAKELGLFGEYPPGIMELAEDTPIGVSLSELFS